MRIPALSHEDIYLQNDLPISCTTRSVVASNLLRTSGRAVPDLVPEVDNSHYEY